MLVTPSIKLAHGPITLILGMTLVAGCGSPNQSAGAPDQSQVTASSTPQSAAEQATTSSDPNGELNESETQSNTTQAADGLSEISTSPDLTRELAAYYPFNGQANDESGHGNHGTIIGATLTADRFGRPDRAYHFDGTDDYIEVPDSDSLDLTFEASISLWLLYEPQPTQDFYTILEKSDPERDGHSRYGIWIIGDQAEFCIEPADNSFQRCLDSEIALQRQTWHHITGTYDGQTLGIYIDGQFAGERKNPRSAISQNAFELFIGSDRYQARTVYTLGTIDDIRIYKRMLTDAEIQLLYQAKPDG
jgi:hypothetical protein